MGFTVTQRNNLLTKILKNTDFTTYGTLYMSLHTASPTDTGANECTGGSYARQVIAFDALSNGATQNTSAVAFAGMPACTVTHYAIWSAVSGGTIICWFPLTASKTTEAGDTVNFAIGEVDIGAT